MIYADLIKRLRMLETEKRKLETENERLCIAFDVAERMRDLAIHFVSKPDIDLLEECAEFERRLAQAISGRDREELREENERLRAEVDKLNDELNRWEANFGAEQREEK